MNASGYAKAYEYCSGDRTNKATKIHGLDRNELGPSKNWRRNVLNLVWG